MDLVWKRVAVAVPFLIVLAVVPSLSAQEWTDVTEGLFKLTASDGSSDDRFGISVALSGNVAVIGARGDEDNGDDSGSAYVFRYDPDTGAWSEEQKLTASDASAADYFGVSVAISGDVVIVGASRESENGTQSGSAYLYRYDAGESEWVEEQKLMASDGLAFDWFGFSVAIAGDLAIVGSVYDDNGGDGNAGSVYVFRHDPVEAEWVEEQKLRASDRDESDRFGVSVSIFEEVILISADRNDDDGDDSGSAYVFGYDADEEEWVEEQKLTASDAEAGQQFGNAVSVSGNVAVIGARLDEETAVEAGAAYVFGYDEDLGEWLELQKLLASDGASRDWFGRYVAISDDVALIGSPGDDDDGWGNGSAYVFRHDGQSREWVEELKLSAAEEESFNQFGAAVALSGSTAIVGDPTDDDDGASSGSVYAFNLRVPFLRGDADGNAIVSVLLDSLFLMEWAFTGGDDPPCRDAADADDDGVVSALLDSLYLMQYGFTGGDPPPDPGIEDCGNDPTDDGLDCSVIADGCV